MEFKITNQIKNRLLDTIIKSIDGLTQVEAGKVLGVSQPEVSRIKSRKTTAKIETLMEHLERLGFSYSLNYEDDEINIHINKPKAILAGGALYIRDLDEDGNPINDFKTLGCSDEPLTFKFEASSVECKEIPATTSLDVILEKGYYKYVIAPSGEIVFKFNMDGFLKIIVIEDYVDDLHELIEGMNAMAVNLYKAIYLGLGDFEEIRDSFIELLDKFRDEEGDEE